jgi:hypothetical protein
MYKQEDRCVGYKTQHSIREGLVRNRSTLLLSGTNLGFFFMLKLFMQRNWETLDFEVREGSEV